jgi:hypothetical protein
LSNIKTDRHDITDIWLKVALNNITPSPSPYVLFKYMFKLKPCINVVEHFRIYFLHLGFEKVKFGADRHACTECHMYCVIP